MESSSDRFTMIQLQMVEAYDQFLTFRMGFMLTDAELSNIPQNINTYGKMISQLRLLTLDEDPSIQHNAVLALGHLVEHSEELATIVAQKDILLRLAQSIPSRDQHQRKAAVSVLRSVAKHSPELAQAVVDCGGLNALVLCLGDVDVEVKEAATSTLINIAKHNATLAQAVVGASGVSLLMSLNTCELAREEVNAGTIALLAQMIHCPETELKKQVLFTLIQIIKHSVELAKMVITADIFSEVMVCLQVPDKDVNKDVITLMWEAVKHGAELSEEIVNRGGLVAVVDYLKKSCGKCRLPGILMLGHVASHSETLAMAVILSKGVHQLDVCLSEEDDHNIKAATVWSIGRIGRHTPEHAAAVATAGLLPKVLQLYTGGSSSEDLRLNSKKALKDILLQCSHLPSLLLLLHNAPSNILSHVLDQLSKVLRHDSDALQEFVKSGGLRKLQGMEAKHGSALKKHIKAIKVGLQQVSTNRLMAKKPQRPQANTQPTPLPPRTPAMRTPASTHPPKPIHDPTPKPRGGPKEPPIRDPSRAAKTQPTPLLPQTPATRPPSSTHTPTTHPRGGPRKPPSIETKTKLTPLPQRNPATRNPASTNTPTPNSRIGSRKTPIRDPSRAAKTQPTPLPPRKLTTKNPESTQLSQTHPCPNTQGAPNPRPQQKDHDPRPGKKQRLPTRGRVQSQQRKKKQVSAALVESPPTITQERRPITPEAADLEEGPVASHPRMEDTC